nr:glutamyl-tRNA amidotransferase [Candidatus Mycoplasma haematolamae]
MGVIFQIYPGSRLLIETILIKIGGALYGPAIGMLIGLLTDLLTVILTSSVFNGGYLLAAIFNGFFGGFIFMLTSTRNRKSLSYWQNTFLVFCMLAITSVVFYLFYSDTFKSSQNNGELKVNIFSQEVKFPQWFFPAFLSSLLGIICLSLTGTLFLSTRERTEALSRKCKKWNTIIRIVAMNFLSYILVDLITLPLFDIKLSTLPYEQFFIMRNVLLIPAVAFSSLIIWKIFKLNKKLQFTESKRILIPLPAGARTGALIRCNPNLKY